VLGAVGATAGLIWISYLLARGRTVFGGERAEWGTVAAWAGGIATFLAALVALLVAAEVFDSLRAPRLRTTFDRAEPWCRTGAHGELWVRVAGENAGRAPAHGCVGRIVGLSTDGHARTDLDPVQLRWAGVPRSRAFDAIDIRPGQREFLNVLVLRPGAGWRLVTFEDPDFDPGFALDLTSDQEHVLILAAVADEVDAPLRSLAQMTDEERLSFVISVSAAPRVRDERYPTNAVPTAGYTPGVPRLDVPALLSADASMGVTNPGFRPDDEGATALPASIVVGASFNPQLAREGGGVIGREARTRGINIMLAGGINLQRDVRSGRTFEYYSEDPWLSAVLAAEAVNGIQAEGVISTLKHYTLNCNETNRHWLNAVIDPDAHRESDLLAFQIAIERSQPGSIMSAYNKINGEYAGGNRHLLNDVLKDAWGYPGYVMSDWARHSNGGTRSPVSTRSPAPSTTPCSGDPSRSVTRSGMRTRTGSFRRSVSPTWSAASCTPSTRSASTNGGRHRRSTWRSTMTSRLRSRGKESCCSRTRDRCHSAQTIH
jgi:Glycosyl hydrolase family 3 N terminal domain